MSDRFQSVTAGQPFRVPAATWNSMLEAARSHEQSKFNRRSGTEAAHRRPSLAKVRNLSGEARDQFDVVGLLEPIIGPTDNFAEFQRQTTFDVGLPIAGARVAVLTEPLAVGAIGIAVVSGATPARVAVSGAVYGCAEPVTGGASYLRSVPHGPLKVLWMEQNGLPVRWAIVTFDDTNYEEIVYITSNIPDSDGYYPAVVQRYDVTSKSWVTQFACKVLDANR